MKSSTAGTLPLTFVVALCSVAVLRWGGSAEDAPVLPRAPAPSTSPSSPTASPSGSSSSPWEVVHRFVDEIGDGTYDAPRFAVGQADLSAHWRKMPVPWIHTSTDAAPRVTSIALRTSATETQWSMPKADGTPWAPDARVWNMNEGSFDQREAIFAPTPATVAFRVRVPAGARLTVAPGLVSSHAGGVTFRVVVEEGQRPPRELHRSLLSPKQAQTWDDVSVDLTELAGHEVTLRFETTAERDEDEGSRPALALWGNPTLLGRGGSRPALPFNVLWIVVDALRPDVLASFHDDATDAALRAAPVPPLEAHLPKIPGLMPVLDGLAAQGVTFLKAYSAGAWTRPGTVAMLAGARSTEVGLDPLPWQLDEGRVARFYGARPPLLPLLLRARGATTRAFVNNYFMVGYAAVGIDLGFERVSDHRYRTRDTLEITREATAWLRAHGDERSFVFCNFNSPHEPWEPPPRMLERVPPPPEGPADDITRRYMAEAAKDDEAIGLLLEALESTGHRKDTLVVVTADHGETLSRDHAGVSKLDNMKVRYHHAVSNYEETTRVPVLLVLPGALEAGRRVEARVRTTDIAPTILELMGLEADHGMSGRSLLGLARGQTEVAPRVVVSEGRGTRAIVAGRYRLLVREGAARTTTRADGEVVTAHEELYDLETDPGERRDLAHSRPDLVAEMRARLQAALANVPAADAPDARDPTARTPAVIQLRFAGGGRPRRIRGTVRAATSNTSSAPGAGGLATLAVTPVGIAEGDAKAKVGPDGGEVELALDVPADAVVGVDLAVSPPSAAVTWTLFEDDAPWPAGGVYAGPFGIRAKAAKEGLANDAARAEAWGWLPPFVDPRRDHGLFVVRLGAPPPPSAHGQQAAGTGAPAPPSSARAREMDRLLREWGYAHGSGGGR